MNLRRAALGAALLGSIVGGAHAAGTGSAQVGDIAIEGAYVRASLGRAPNSAAYMTVTTAGAEPDRLIGGSTPAAERVELHATLQEDGVMKMRPLQAVEVAPGEAAVLQPGGVHLMLLNLTEPLVEGETIDLSLSFERAGVVTLEVPIVGLGGGGHDAGHGGMDHGHSPPTN